MGMPSSLPNLEAVKVAIDDPPPTRRALVLLERPTVQSMEAVRLAEAESRIARGEPELELASGVSALDGPAIATMRDLYADGDVDAALSLAGDVTAELQPTEPEPFELDPYGGLIPVEEEDPYGGLIPVEEDEPIPESASDLPLVSANVPTLLVDPASVASLPMDPRAAFLLGYIDGVQSLDDILDVCAMPEGEAMEILDRLRGMGVISY